MTEESQIEAATSTRRSPLLPMRHETKDFFICDIWDVIPKDDMGSMEHPIFSLSTKPDTRELSYSHNGSNIRIVPSVRGLATIHDKDVLIYCMSQLVAKMNDGEEPSREVYVQAYDLLVATNRETSGDGYRRLREGFERLQGTQITTDIATKGEKIAEGFGLIDSWRIVRRSDSGRMVSIKITLSEWLYNAVLGHEVLTIHRDYFRIRKPLERRVYEIARKHCGRKPEWVINLDTLQKKSGSNSPPRVFRAMVKKLAEHDHLPDYLVELANDKVTFRNREAWWEEQAAEPVALPVLDPDTRHDARILAPGYDVDVIRADWLEHWAKNGKPEFKNADKAFLGFCRTWAQRRGPAR